MNVPANRAAPNGALVPHLRRRPLKTLDDVRKQMATLYWDARRGTIPTEQATRLVYILVQIGRVIEGGEIERRIAALESAVEHVAPITATPPTGGDADDEGED